jgi:hypothetical protein
VMIAESVIASGVEPSSFVAALSVGPVAKGISKNLQQGNVDCVVRFLKKTEELGVSILKFLDGVAIDLLKKECIRIVNCGDVEQVVYIMETLAGNFLQSPISTRKFKFSIIQNSALVSSYNVIIEKLCIVYVTDVLWLIRVLLLLQRTSGPILHHKNLC